MSDLNMMSPLRLSTYRDEKNNTQIFQWVIGEYEASQLIKWENVVNGSSAIVQDVTEPQLVKNMYFVVTKNTTSGNSVLTIGDVPELTNDGKCVRGGDIVSYDIDEELYKSNNLSIYINGVKVADKEGDVSFVGNNKVRIAMRLQVDDVISFDYLQGS